MKIAMRFDEFNLPNRSNLRFRAGLRLMGVVVLLALGSAALAQQAPPEQQRLLAEPFRLLMDEQVPLEKRVLFDWGGWFRSSVWDADDNVDRDFDGRDDGRHVLRWQQLRLWGYLNLDQVHSFYSRGRLDYLDWNHHTSFDGDDSEWIEPKLDRLWYDFQLSRAQKAYGQTPGDFDFSMRLGRQYVVLGTGLALSIPLDAVLMKAQYQQFQLRGLLALSTTDAINIDRSVPDEPDESRCYWGVELRYNGWRDHEPFAYFFAQEDKDGGLRRTIGAIDNNDDGEPDEFIDQTFGYDSRYTGLGSRGKFFHRDLQYTCEFVLETGKSYAYSQTSNPQNIHAWAFDTELRYVVPDEHNSQVLIEYVFASGDNDRTGSPTDTVGGNRLHSPDRSFSAWGFRNTGLGLAPRLSNLGIIRLGASTFPAPRRALFKELLLGADLFFYHKHQGRAAISDDLSTEHNNFVGTGIDIYANWRIASDIAWTVRYGVFVPDNAFRKKTDRQQFFTGLTLNF